ncbi:MAG: extracellular solute-binding protein, partial [Clostridiales bacterium]|nr:extracellular solute-binding protein [Clostridiales bacterium]
MKKKTMAKIGSLALASMLTVPMFAGCGDEGGATASGGNANAEYSLQIYVYEQGYGKGWVEKAAQEFVKKYPNYKYTIHGDGGALEKMYTQIKYDNCKVEDAPIDIALIDDSNYYELVGLGKLVDLTDLMDAELPDSDQKVKDIIPQDHLDWRAVNGVQYGIPWQDNCANGIIYNKSFFEKYDLQVPETMDEYFELCEEILALDLWDDPTYSDVEAPLVWAGAGG